MSMSEDVAGATISMASQGVSIAGSVATKTLDAIIKLLQLMNRTKENRHAMNTPAGSETEISRRDHLQELRMRGEVSINDLREYTAKSQQKLVYSEQGLTKANVAAISHRAKQVGIPVAFTRPADRKTYYPAVSEYDLPLFKQIVQGRISEKLTSDRENPTAEREYSQIAVKKWEIPIIAKDCQRRDIQASFAPHPNDPNLAVVIYPTADKAGMKEMTDAIAKNCRELEDVKIEQNQEGFCTITDENSGRVYSFEADNTCEEVLSYELQDKMGFDAMKADLAAAKYEAQCLAPEDVPQFKEGEPQHAFYAVQEITIRDKATGRENPITEPYRMNFFQCKYENKPIFSISNPNGKVLILPADQIRRRNIVQALQRDFGIKDRRLLHALTLKFEQCARGTLKDNLHSNKEFSRGDFDLSTPQAASGMRRTAADGTVFVKKQPIDSVSLRIERTGKNTFSVTSTAKATEYDPRGAESTAVKTMELQLTLRHPKQAYDKIRETLVSQGVPAAQAKELARDAVSKAHLQPEERIVFVDSSSKESVTCFTSAKEAEIPIKEGRADPEVIKDTFGVSDEAAEQAAENIQEELMEPEELADTESLEDEDTFSEVAENGHEMHPEGNILSDAAQSDTVNPLNSSGGTDNADAVSDAVESIADNDDSSSIGAR